jgi:hypothetical protein
MWLLDFFVAHHLRLNPKKTHICIGSATGISANLIGPLLPTHLLRFLPDIDEELVHCPSARSPAPGPYREMCKHLGLDPSSIHLHQQAIALLQTRLLLPSPFSTLAERSIVTSGPSHAFRYLGYMIRIDLAPDEEIEVLRRRVMEVCTKIKTHTLDLFEASCCIREFLYPRLELGLIFARIAKSVLVGWDALIRSYVLGRHQGVNVHSVALEPFQAAIGILPMYDYATLVKNVELGICLRSTLPPCARSAWGRIRSAVLCRSILTTTQIHNGESWTVVTSVINRRSNRITGILQAAAAVGIKISWRSGDDILNGHSTSAPATLCSGTTDRRIDCPILEQNGSPSAHWSLCAPSETVSNLVAFTDGSYSKPGHSGYASIVCRGGDLWTYFDFNSNHRVTLAGGSPRAGGSYSAELSAIIATLFAIPLNAHILFVSDSLSACQAIGRPLVNESHRLRLGCRAQLKTIRQLIETRATYGGRTSFDFTRAHTELTDTLSRGNAIADKAANTAAHDDRYEMERDSPFLFNEERAVFWQTPEAGTSGKDWHIPSDLRITLQRRLKLASLKTWQDRTSSQGNVARSCGSLLLSHLDFVRRTCDGSLLLFALLLCTEQLPTSDRLIFPLESRTQEDILCPRCLRRPQSASHSFKCISVRHRVRDLRESVRIDLEFLVKPILDARNLCDQDHQTVSAAPSLLRWYDPSSEFPSNLPDADSVDSFNRIAGIAGIIPPGLADLLRLDPKRSGVRECLQSSVRKTNASLLADLSLSILRRARGIFEDWYGRPFSVVPIGRPRGTTTTHQTCPPDDAWPQNLDLLGQQVLTRELDGSNHPALVISVDCNGEPTLDYGEAGIFALPASRVTPKRIKRDAFVLSPPGSLHNPRRRTTVAVLAEDGSAFLAKVVDKFQRNELNLLHRETLFSSHASCVRMIKREHSRPARPPKPRPKNV